MIALRRKIAARVSQSLFVQDGQAIRAPGAKVAWQHTELDGRAITVVSRGDAFDLYFGRKAPVAISITPRAALRLSWFFLWSWWGRATLFGLKTILWNWSLSVLLDPEATDAPPQEASSSGLRRPQAGRAQQRPSS